MGIPSPSGVKKETSQTSICELYDGTPETANYCGGWITKTNKCTRRQDELGTNCDGCGNFPPEIMAKHQ